MFLPSCPAFFFLFFQGWSCNLTVAACVGVWRTGFVMAHFDRNSQIVYLKDSGLF